MQNSDATRSQEQLAHLAQVRALSTELASAISAIEKNDLRQFETHLVAQEAICNRLAGTATPTAQTVPGDLMKEIRQAHLTLAQLNRVYSAVLQRAQRSAGLIATLYRGHGEGYDRAPSPLPQRHSWSCEV
jgi:hypothetical protein